MALILKGRAKLKGSTVIGKRPYAIDGVFNPELVADFQKQYYRASSASTTFSGLITHTRASTATYVDSTGTLQTAAINEPRLGHHVWNGTAWVNEGLLHESEARTNVLTYSDFDAAVPTNWSVGFSTGTFSHTLGTEIQGTPTITHVQSTDGRSYLSQNLTLSASTTYTISCKFDVASSSVTSGSQTILLITGLADITVPSPIFDDIDPVTGLLTVTFTTAADTTGQLRLGIGSAANATGTLVFSQPQLEAAPTPSSYIPTAGSTVTRSADVLTIPAANLPYPEPVVIGPELVTNGTFDTDSDWTKGTGWTISGGVASSAGSNNLAELSQTGSFPTGKVYQITYTASNYVSGSFRINFFGGGNSAAGATYSANGTYTEIFAGNDGFNRVAILSFGGSGCVCDFDNISVREINPLALSIQMDGKITYADTDSFNTVVMFTWGLISDPNQIQLALDTNGASTGEFNLLTKSAGVTLKSAVLPDLLPDVLVPFNAAGRVGSNFVRVSSSGVNGDLFSPTSLPPLSATNLRLGFTYNGTIRTFRMWGQDIGNAGIAEATT